MASPFSRFGMALVGLGALALATMAAAPAEEVQWRHDYGAARREATDTGRPIVMDFGTPDCCWCKKLDATTFRDPAVVKLLNEQFIPIKVDAERDPRLAESLGIQSFPTLVFARPDGHVLGMEEGFLDAAAFGQRLQRTLKDCPPAAPKPQSPVISTQAGEAAPGKPSDRITPPPFVPAAAAAERGRLAHDLLAAAREDFSKQRYLGCLERCDALASEYAELPEAGEARQLAGRIKDDPELLQRACAKIEDRLGELYLGLADDALRRNQPQRAGVYLESVLRTCPTSTLAQVAQGRLNDLRRGLAQLPASSKTVRAQAP